MFPPSWSVFPTSYFVFPPSYFLFPHLTSQHIVSPIWAENCLWLDNYLLQWVKLLCVWGWWWWQWQRWTWWINIVMMTMILIMMMVTMILKQLPVAQSIPFIICTISSRTLENLLSKHVFGLVPKKSIHSMFVVQTGNYHCSLKIVIWNQFVKQSPQS